MISSPSMTEQSPHPISTPGESGRRSNEVIVVEDDENENDNFDIRLTPLEHIESHVHITPPQQQRPRKNLYLNCLNLQCPFPQPEEINLLVLCNEIECSDLFDRIERDLLDDLPKDCDFATIFHEVVGCCQSFFRYVTNTEYYHVNRIIDCVLCDYDLSELPYSLFIQTFMERVERMLAIENFSFDECRQSDIMAIRHGMENMKLLQKYLMCYATANVSDLQNVFIKFFMQDIVKYLVEPFNIDNSLFGDRYLYEIMQVCIFKNTYNMCSVKGVSFSGILLRCLLQGFFQRYNLLRNYLFTEQRSILHLIRPSVADKDDAFETFVDVVIHGLSCQKKKNRLYYTDFLLLYTQRINPSFASRSRLRFLFQRLISFMKNYSYESKPLDVVLCYLLRFEMAAMKTKSDLINSLLCLQGWTRNSQLGRYVVEVALLVLQNIMIDIEKARQNNALLNSGVSSFQRELLLFLEVLDKTHAQYVLAFDFNPFTECCDAYLSASHYICFQDSIRQLFADKSAASEIAQKLHCDGNKTRTPMCLLHSWVYRHADPFRSAISTELNYAAQTEECKWYLLFFAIFDHMKKFGAFWSDAKYQLEVTHPSDNQLHSLYESFSNLRAQINPAAFRAEAPGAFYNRILDNLAMYTKAVPSVTEVDLVLSQLKQRINSLCLALSMTRNFDRINTIKYEEVLDDDLHSIMSDNSESQVLICDTNANEYLLAKFVIPYITDGGSRLHIYGQGLKEIKPRFDMSTSVFEKHVQELQKCADKGVFLEDYTRDMECNDLTEEERFKIALLQLQNQLVQGALTKQDFAKVTEEKDRYGAILKLFRDFDALAERKIASYKFSLKEMWKACCEQNPDLGLDENSDYDDNNAEGRDQCLRKYKEMLLTKFNNKYPGDIQNFENNQVVALYLLHKQWNTTTNKGVNLFRIGTGQGKTLTEAAAAIQYLQKKGEVDKKVIILTAFSHLAIRDKAAMENLYRQFGYNSVVLDSASDASNFTQAGTHVIYADSQKLSELIKSNSVSAHPNLDLLKFALNSWENYLVILDEVDILLKKEEHFFLNNCSHLFDEGNLKTSLQAGKYQSVNKFFEVENTLRTQLTSATTNTKKDMDEVNQVITYASSLGAQIERNELLLYGACFSWKAKLQQVGKNVIGFSGTLNQNTFRTNCEIYFPNTDLTFWKIPLFFSPTRNHGDVTRRKVYGDESQIDWLSRAIAEKETPSIANEKISSALEQSAWVSMIKSDCDEARRNLQGILIFAYVDANSSPDCDFMLLKSSNVADIVYDNSSCPSDTELQKIAIPGRVTLCCKKVGRGADIRVPILTQEGLHVIIASPDYPEEMMQQIGRTGRMNRRGSYSIIYRTGAVKPTYGNSETADVLRVHNLGMELSGIFFNSYGTNSAKRKYFCWFIYLLITYGAWKYDEKSAAEVEGVSKSIRDLFNQIVVGP